MDSKALEKKLSGVKDTSEDIQELSRWCIHQRNNYHSIVQAWSRAVRKAKLGHRLTLFYVCNDVVQNARRKKYLELVQHFATAIKEATPLVRDEKIKKKIIRIFTIWEERGVYDSKLISELTEIIENVGTVNATENDVVLSTFQLVRLVEGIRSLIALEKTSRCLLADLKSQEYILSPEEIAKVQATVKERGASRERLEEFEESVLSLECYIASLHKETEERTKVVTLLEQAEIFYETQRGEAKLVANAYKSFSNQVKTLKAKLLEKLPHMKEPSPVTTPPHDAPSPGADNQEVSKDEDVCSANLESDNMPCLDSFLDSSFTTFAEGATKDIDEIEEFKQSSNMQDKTIGSSISSFTLTNSYQDNHADVIPLSPSPEPKVRQGRSRSASRSNSHSRDERRSSLNRESELDREQREFEFQLSKITSHSYQEPKPMSAQELLDTFGKSYLAKSTSASSSTGVSSHIIHSPPVAHIATSAPSLPALAPPHPPSVPQVVVPPPPPPPPPPVSVSGLFSLPAPNAIPLSPHMSGALPIPLPPSKPPPTTMPPPDFLPQVSESYLPPPPSSPPKTSFPPPPLPSNDVPLFPPPFPPPPPTATSNENGSTWPMWMAPPPPPPPPPPVPPSTTVNGPNNGPQGEDGRAWGTSEEYSRSWSYEDEYDGDQDTIEEEADDRNWGEPPGNEELQAFSQSENSQSPSHNVGYFPSVLPPPPAPPLSNFSNREAEGERRLSTADERSNLVNIEPCSDEDNGKETRDNDYTCYDYRSLAQESDQPVDQAIVSNTNAKVKKQSVKHSVESGSDMDISDADSASGEHGSKKKSRLASTAQVSKANNVIKRDKPDPHYKDSIGPFKKDDETPPHSFEHKPISFSFNRGRNIISLTSEQDDSRNSSSKLITKVEFDHENDFEPNYKKQRTLSLNQDDERQPQTTNLQTEMVTSPTPSWEDHYNIEEDIDSTYIDNVDTVTISKALEAIREQSKHGIPERGDIAGSFFQPELPIGDKPSVSITDILNAHLESCDEPNKDTGKDQSMTQVIQSFISGVRGDSINSNYYDNSFQTKSEADCCYKEAENFLDNLQCKNTSDENESLYLKEKSELDRNIDAPDPQPITPLYSTPNRNLDWNKSPFQNFDTSLFKRKEPLLPLGVVPVSEETEEQREKHTSGDVSKSPSISSLVKEEFQAPEHRPNDLYRNEPLLHFIPDTPVRHEDLYQRPLPRDRPLLDLPPMENRSQGQNSLFGPRLRLPFDTMNFREKFDNFPRGRGFRFNSPRERGSFDRGRGGSFNRHRFNAPLDISRGRGGTFSPRGGGGLFPSPRIRGSVGFNFPRGRGRGHEFFRGRGGQRGIPWR